MLRNTPQVSVIVIFLNGERFLPEALDSVLAQTFTDWEMHLIDDGSGDAASAVARSYAGREPDRIFYHEHPNHENRGMSASRNVGLAASRGKYIALLDADDLWTPNKLAEQVAILESRPEIDLLYGHTRVWHSWTSRAEDQNRDWTTQDAFAADTVLAPPTLLTRYLRDESQSPCTSSLLLRRDALIRVGGWDESFRAQYEDAVLYAKLALTSSALICDREWDRYRQHAENSSFTGIDAAFWHPSRANPAQRRFLEWVEAFLAEKNVGDAALCAALQQALLPYRHPVRHRIRQSASRGVRRLTRMFHR